MWRQVGSGVTGYSSLPTSQAPEAGNLIQPFVQYPGSRLASAGEAWRQVRNNWIIPYGASLLCIALLGIAILYFGKGPMGRDHSAEPAKIERFTPFERAVHWSNAFAFCALAFSGIVMSLGKFFLLPIFGGTLFGWLTYLLKNLHNFVGPLFAVSLALIVVIFIKDNIAKAADFVWLSKAGGMLGEHEVPSHRFNAGEKGIFWWGVTIPGLIIVASGLVLDRLVPGLGIFRSDMQIAHLFHSVAAFWMMAMIIGHAYMGIVGVRGALDGMKTGYVSEAWAKEHHDLWLEDIHAGKIPAVRTQPQGGHAVVGGKPAQV
jgi:formate dehydrogenase subunit gamma